MSTNNKPEADQDFFDALWRYATNNGDAYRDDKNAARAVYYAFEEYQQDRRHAEQVDYALCKERLIADLERRWLRLDELDRDALLNILEGYGFAVFDHESDAELREAVRVNIKDGTIPADVVESYL
jgi:hypothetical protein